MRWLRPPVSYEAPNCSLDDAELEMQAMAPNINVFEESLARPE
jgi:hypothetical protein